METIHIEYKETLISISNDIRMIIVYKLIDWIFHLLPKTNEGDFYASYLLEMLKLDTERRAITTSKNK